MKGVKMDYKLGLVAKDIQNSVTPTVYSAFAADLGLEISFDIMNIPEDKLSDTLEYARQNLNGFNITMPYKQAALAYMDELDETAVQCGSTNTVLVQSGRLIAYNTDGWGLIRALKQRGVEVENADVVMLGAGGVGYSIAYNLMVNRVRSVKVVNIFLDQAEALCQKFGPVFTPHPLTYENLASCCENADLFINASVMGQIGYDEFTSFDFLKELNLDATVFDVNYSNPNSKLVPTAGSMGIPAYNGKSMTACQGIRAMEIWTGKAPSDEAAIALVESFN
jgi:shikimate dehydrogenase